MIKLVSGKRLLYVMAAQQEFGPALSQRFTPLITGVGPVEASVALASFLAGDTLPDLVVSLGSAGSETLEQTEVYQIASVSYRDMDASALGFEKGITPFLDIAAVLPMPFRLPDIPAVSLSTGANIVSGEAYKTIDADMVDMETFAIRRACDRFGVPLIGLRGVSDGKAELRHVEDWTQYLHIIDEKLAAVIDRLEQAVADGEIEL